MKWYYKWKLNKIRAEIDKLRDETQSRLLDNYTDHLRLRSLTRLEEYLQERVSKYQSSAST